MKVDIYFYAVGMIDIPAAEEIRAMIEEIKKYPNNSAMWHKKGNGATPHGVTPYLHRDYFLMGLTQTAVPFCLIYLK